MKTSKAYLELRWFKLLSISRNTNVRYRRPFEPWDEGYFGGHLYFNNGLWKYKLNIVYLFTKARFWLYCVYLTCPIIAHSSFHLWLAGLIKCSFSMTSTDFTEIPFNFELTVEIYKQSEMLKKSPAYSSSQGKLESWQGWCSVSRYVSIVYFSRN